MSKRHAIFPAGRRALYDMHRYSAAIRSGDLLFVSGQVGSRADGSRPRWHRLTLWSTALFHSRTVIRSNQYEELERAAALFNEAIGKALSHQSPPNHVLQATCEDARA